MIINKDGEIAYSTCKLGKDSKTVYYVQYGFKGEILFYYKLYEIKKD